jgi:hypothetical protein
MDNEDGSQDTSAEIDPEIQRITNELNGRTWGQAAPPTAVQEEPNWREMTPDELMGHPMTPPATFDLSHDSNDDAAWNSVLPDMQEAAPQSRGAKLLSLLGNVAVGGMAGRAASEQAVAQSGGRRGGGFGGGFTAGQGAIQAMADEAAKRQQQADLAAWQQARTENLQAKTKAYPAQQDAFGKYRDARTQYLKAQAGRVQAEIDKLKRGPADRPVGGYVGDDGKKHVIFAKPDGGTYESIGEKPVYHGPIVTKNAHGTTIIDPLTYQVLHQIPNPPSGPKPMSEAQKQRQVDRANRADEWKMTNLNRLHKQMQEGAIDEPEYYRQWQDVQDHYEDLVKGSGGSVTHVDVRTGANFNPASKADANDPLGIR